MSHPNKENEVEGFVMPLGEHIEELRWRVLKCLLVAGGAFMVAWAFRSAIMDILILPHVRAMEAFRLEPTLKFQSYLEPVLAQLKACMIAALVVTAPYLLYQVWGFIAPGLYRRERKFVVRLGAVSALCFLTGVLFGYFVFIPTVLRFLLVMSGPQMQPLLMIGPYLSLLLLMTLALGIVFQTPLVIYYLVRWDIVSAAALQKQRKLAILAAFIVAGAITPTVDPVTQTLTAVPLILLYDLGALAAAPGKETVFNFVRFTGIIAVIAGLLAGAYFLWPIGHVTVLQGTAMKTAKPLPTNTRLRLSRGATYELGVDSLARIDFERDAEEPDLLVAGPAQFQVQSKWEVSLQAGSILADSTLSKATLEVHTRPADVSLQGGKAELLAPDSNTLTLNVLEGEAVARVEGRNVRILAGRSQTFHWGGAPTEDGTLEDRWRRRLEEADLPTPPP